MQTTDLTSYETAALHTANTLVTWAVENSQATLDEAKAQVAAMLRMLVQESKKNGAADDDVALFQQAYLNVAATLERDPDADDLPHNQPDSHLDAAYEDRFTLEDGMAEWEEWR